MPRNPFPKYRRQRDRRLAVDLAFVELGGKRHYLGEWGSEESKELYRRRLAEWQAAGKGPTPPRHEELSILELVDAFWAHAKSYYRHPDGTETSELSAFKTALRPLKALYGESLAVEFGPRALRVVREQLVREGKGRSSINRTVNRIRHVFKWAVSEELLPASVHEALRTLQGLKRGRTDARESRPVLPVPEAHVEALQPHVSRQVWALIQLQLLTGARSGELVGLRPCDVERSDPVWTFRPAEHKTAYRGHERTIYFGPKAQDVLRPFLQDRPLSQPCFSPAEAETERRATLHATRTTPLRCGNVPGSRRARKPARPPGEWYDPASYARAIARACKSAGVPHWHPHQLRHATATRLRKEYGIDIARVILGHRTPSTTDIYAELDREKALAVAERIG